MDATLDELTAHLPQLSITSISLKPTMLEGELHGLAFRLRYRAGTASLIVGGGAIDPLYQASTEYGSEWASTLPPQELVDLLTQLISQLQRAARQWAFADLDSDQVHLGWGHTADEAHKTIIDSYRLAGLPVPNIDHDSYTVDDRIWPEPEPNFTENA